VVQPPRALSVCCSCAVPALSVRSLPAITRSSTTRRPRVAA